MPNLVWLLSAAPSTDYDILGEALEALTKALSEQLSIWGISWNPHLPGRTYELHIWNGRGRLIGFQGQWRLTSIAEQMEQIWRLEGFLPHLVLHCRIPWRRKLIRRWQRRFGVQALPATPFPSEPPLLLAGGYEAELLLNSEPQTIALFVQREGAAEAAFLADLLALEKYQIVILGTPREATPLRAAHARFPDRIHLRLGAPWMETVLYLLRSRAIIAVGKPFGEEVLLQVGRPWIVPAQHPLSGYAQASYDRIESVPAILQEKSLPSQKALGIQEFVERVKALVEEQCKT
ncbi:MAG: hypothetical protein ABDH66_01985 [Bacteroidia bacterium]